MAAAVAERLNEVVPAGYTVTAHDTYVTVLLDGDRVGGTAAAEFLESIDGLKTPEETLVRAARVIMDNVQHYIADTSTEPWPGERSQPSVGVALIGDRLEMWFGDRDTPVLRLAPLRVPARGLKAGQVKGGADSCRIQLWPRTEDTAPASVKRWSGWPD